MPTKAGNGAQSCLVPNLLNTKDYLVNTSDMKIKLYLRV